MSNTKQTCINQYFKSAPKSTKALRTFKEFSTERKEDMDKTISEEINYKALQRMKNIVNQFDFDKIKLPFPLPTYGSDSDDSVTYVGTENNVTQAKHKSCDDDCELLVKKCKKKQTTTRTKKKKQENQNAYVKEKSFSSVISTDKENSNDKVNSAPAKKKISTYIGVYSPSKAAENIRLLNESTSKRNDERIDNSTMNVNHPPVLNCKRNLNENSLLNEKGRLSINTITSTKEDVDGIGNCSISETSISKDEINDELKPWVFGLVQKIVEYTLSHNSLNRLLTSKETSTLNELLDLPKEEYILFCIKLYTRTRKWYNVFKLTNLVNLNLSDSEVVDMYQLLSEKGLVDNDYSSEPIESLLEHLPLPDLKQLCAKFKLKIPQPGTKNMMIEKLQLHSNCQATLTFAKSTKSILIDRIKEKMGYCVKINPFFYDSLHKAHLLYKLPVNDFQKISDLHLFMGKIRDGTIVMPQIRVNDNFEIFSSISTYTSFQKAYEVHEKIINLIEKKSLQELYHFCNVAFEELKIVIQDDGADDRPSCIQRFTPGYQYAKALSTGIKHLTRHHPDKVSEWLLFLIEQSKFCKRLTGSWYNTLLIVQYTHLKQHKTATETLIKALREKNLHKFDLVDLNVRAEKIKRSQKNKITQLEFETISQLQPVLTEDFPFIEIDSQAIRHEGSPRKRNYYEKSENGVEFLSVEMVALRHYYNNGYTSGVHCEGTLLVTIFFILFWDIIYTDKVPHAFICEIQYCPLDLMSPEFYANRSECIGQRLVEIESGWSLNKLEKFVCEMWVKHAHEKSFINSNLIKEPTELYDILLCIGRIQLRKIMERLLMDFKNHHSGLPDLFLWNISDRKCKYVEVKGENDKLSAKQTCWLDFLRSIGADIEVCHVHTMGSKRRTRGTKKRTRKECKTPERELNF